MTDSSKETSKGAWTPGPWKSLHDADGDYAICRANFSDERLIAITDSDEPEDEANALLISKAPQMADLLRELCKVIQSVTEMDDGVCYFNGRYMGNLEKPLDDARRLLTDLEVKP